MRFHLCCLTCGWESSSWGSDKGKETIDAGVAAWESFEAHVAELHPDGASAEWIEE